MRDTAAARALFQEGVACADRSDWTCAADRFARAHELRASAVIAYNLGHALVESGRLVEGTEILRRLVRDESVAANVRADAARVIRDAEPRIGRLAVHLRGPHEDVEVALGTHELASSLLGTAAPVDPGEHVLEARRDGEIVASARVHIDPGATEEIELEIPARPARATASAIAPEAAAQTAFDATGARDVAPSEGGDDGTWIALGVAGGVLVVAAAVVVGVVLAAPAQEPAPFDGTLGWVEIGR
ncbi:hypothetical protein [Sandaracinus amylolyticus]|uniref:Tetratricopeptide repeat protein n=1 Tax=Sandaracinus amylolyticus TaxID=927083 RepID=A0A0F6YHU0_9BACT|nr:hypothetical protein [Sandaracinus amylolyticus]AKF06007.1 hypothetical protein DB32_003156 [Sandaracinus amylolyticus]